LTLLAVPRVGAQVAGALDIGSGVGQFGNDAWLRESRFTPALRGVSRFGFFQFEGAAVERMGRFAVRHASLDGSLRSPAFGVFRLSLDGHIAHDGSLPTAQQSGFDVGPSLSARFGRGGAWIGGARAQQTITNVRAGAWRVLGPAIVSVTTTRSGMRLAGRPARYWNETVMDSTYNDTLGRWNLFPVQRVRGDSGTSSRLQQWSDVEARVDWSLGRLAVTAAMSARPPIDSARSIYWGRIDAAFQLNSRVTLVTRAGTLPAIRSFAAPSARYASVGVRLSPSAFFRPPLPAGVRPAASGFALESLTGGAYRVTLTVPHARTVELSGDFNGWSAVPLREKSAGRWEAVVALPPGTHRLSVRVDGDRWTAPPGVPAVDDEFNGRVGIVVIR
jgi:hypothetical protein